MKKAIILGSILLLSFFLVGCDDWLTTTQTFTYEIDDIASTNQDVDVYWLDLTTNSTYEEHRDNIRSVDQISVVGRIINHGTADAAAEIWADTTEQYNTPNEVRDNSRLIFATPIPLPLPPGETTLVDWSNGLEYMEDGAIPYLDSLVRYEGAFAIYGLAAETPFDIEIQAEVVITVTVGR